ncbi:hypothetical protein AB4Y44_01960 [Paraburkholderia sp. BR10937]
MHRVAKHHLFAPYLRASFYAVRRRSLIRSPYFRAHAATLSPILARANVLKILIPIFDARGTAEAARHSAFLFAIVDASHFGMLRKLGML